MFDIFISYAREDERRAKELADVLEGYGWSVFWDQTIPTGKTWRNYIGQALTDARCVIVLWSQVSINSAWVIEEADEGKRRQVLTPVLIESVEPPLGFRQIQAADLKGWRPGQTSQKFNRLIEDIGKLVRSEATPARSPLSGEYNTVKPANTAYTSAINFRNYIRNKIHVIVGMIVIIVAATGYFFARNIKFQSSGKATVGDSFQERSTSQMQYNQSPNDIDERIREAESSLQRLKEQQKTLAVAKEESKALETFRAAQTRSSEELEEEIKTLEQSLAQLKSNTAQVDLLRKRERIEQLKKELSELINTQ
jgi:hypothetical protein